MYINMLLHTINLTEIAGITRQKTVLTFTHYIMLSLSLI